MVSCAVSVIALPDMQFMWWGPFPPSVSVNATIPSAGAMMAFGQHEMSIRPRGAESLSALLMHYFCAHTNPHGARTASPLLYFPPLSEMLGFRFLVNLCLTGKIAPS